MAVARDLKGQTHNVVCVIGDGAMSAGMAYEAMNNAGAMDSRLIVILNDNKMSIAPPVGALSAYLARLVSGRPYRSLREIVQQLAKRLPKFLEQRARAVEEYARGLVTGGTLFEELGFFYVGPIDGHNLDHLLPVLRNVRDAKDGPILVHVVTQKGKGYAAGRSLRRQVSRRREVRRRDRQAGQGQGERALLHQGVRREPREGGARRTTGSSRSRPRCRRGTGIDIFGKAFPERTFDVGIAEQHGGDLRGGPGDRRLQAVRRDLLDLPAARLRPGRARRRDPAAAGALRARPRRPRRRRRARPTRARSISPISAACRASS